MSTFNTRNADSVLAGEAVIGFLFLIYNETINLTLSVILVVCGYNTEFLMIFMQINLTGTNEMLNNDKMDKEIPQNQCK